MDASNGTVRESNKKTAVIVTAAALFFLGIFILLVLQSHEYNPMAFTLSGTQFREADPKGTKGYDGQFAYYIASNPLYAHHYMDEPGKRYQRILYPILVWFLSLGGLPAVIPWVMLGINLIAVTVSTGILAWMLAERGANAWFAFVYMFYAGVLFAVRADLNEPLAIMLSLGGWYAYQKRRIKFAFACFALAGLAKEIGLIFPFAIALWELMRKQWYRGMAILWVSFLPYGVLFIILQCVWGNSMTSLIPNWLPFSGMAALQDRAFFLVEGVWVLFPLLILLILLLWDLFYRKSENRNLETWMLWINIGFLSIMPYQTWEDPLAVLRSAIPFLITAMIWLAQRHKRWLPYAAVLWSTSSVILFLTPGMVF